jgi:hypothetical protein
VSGRDVVADLEIANRLRDSDDEESSPAGAD